MDIKLNSRVDYKGGSFRVDEINDNSEDGLTIRASACAFAAHVHQGAEAATTQQPAAPAPKRKPFDLEAAKAGAKLVTRNGKAARFLGHAPEVRNGHQVVAYVEGEKIPLHFSEGGRFTPDGAESPYDLFLVAETKAVYLNIYRNTWDQYTVREHDNETNARMLAEQHAVAVAVPVEIDA